MPFCLLKKYLPAVWMELKYEGEWIHVYVWLGPFAVHLQLSQHCKKKKKKSLLVCYVVFFFGLFTFIFRSTFYLEFISVNCVRLEIMIQYFL